MTSQSTFSDPIILFWQHDVFGEESGFLNLALSMKISDSNFLDSAPIIDSSSISSIHPCLILLQGKDANKHN